MFLSNCALLSSNFLLFWPIIVGFLRNVQYFLAFFTMESGDNKARFEGNKNLGGGASSNDPLQNSQFSPQIAPYYQVNFLIVGGKRATPNDSLQKSIFS